MFNFRKKRTASLENLYEVFGKYTTAELDCCECRHDQKHVEMLKRKPLKDLSENDLLGYFSSALLTCQGIDAFKYFLPRLCELYRTDISELRWKLEHINWKEGWPSEEVEALENHLLSEWSSAQFPYCFEDYLAFFSYSRLESLWEENPTFLRIMVEYWTTEEDYFFFTDYWNAEKRSAPMSEEDRTRICAFLIGVANEHLEDPEYETQIMQVRDWFDWCEPSKTKRNKNRQNA